jgi:hypothetical protein
MLAAILFNPCSTLPMDMENVSGFAEDLVGRKDRKKGGKDGGLRKLVTCLQMLTRTTETKRVLVSLAYLILTEVFFTQNRERMRPLAKHVYSSVRWATLGRVGSLRGFWQTSNFFWSGSCCSAMFAIRV